MGGSKRPDPDHGAKSSDPTYIDQLPPPQRRTSASACNLQGVMPFHFNRRRRLALVLEAVLIVFASACTRGETPSSAAAAPPPMAVSTVTLQKKPIEQSSGFIATIKSIRSSTVQPEVEGVV